MMKHVLSVSIGSSSRNSSMELNILGEKILVERVGTDGNLEKAAAIFREYDGKVDAFGLGGADLGFMIGQRYFPIHSIKKIAESVRKTPLTDGIGLKQTLEAETAGFLEEHLRSWLNQYGRTVFLMVSVSRWGMTQSFIDAGYQCTFGDLMFTLGIQVPVHSGKTIQRINSMFSPVVTRLPFNWVYPYNSEDRKPEPKFGKHFLNSTVFAGDCIYLKRSLPENLHNKLIVTNSTTQHDTELFRQRGISYLMTTTPIFDGRSFGTNVLEAIITAISGKTSTLSTSELKYWIKHLQIEPQIRQLN